MKKLAEILTWFFPCFVLGLGVLLITTTFGVPFQSDRIAALAAKPISAFTGLLLTVLGALFFVARHASRTEAHRINIAGGKTGATITVGAIQDYVKKIIEEFPIIVSLDADITSKDSSLSMTLHVTLANPAHVGRLAEQVCERVRTGLHQDLGLEKIGTIELNVKGIRGKSSLSPATK